MIWVALVIVTMQVGTVLGGAAVLGTVAAILWLLSVVVRRFGHLADGDEA